MGLLDTVVVRQPRPLPVIALIDVSGSMADDDKIGVCNAAVREMIASLAAEEDVPGEIQFAAVTFGGTVANLHQELQPVTEVSWEDMKAGGRTPMGGAMRIAGEMVEDRDIIPSRSYLPTIVLISDGIPTDSWQEELKRLGQSERASRAMRLAVAIQSQPGDASYEVLDSFVGEKPGRIFQARDVEGIRKALRWVTFAVTERAKSRNPNDDIDMSQLDELG